MEKMNDSEMVDESESDPKLNEESMGNSSDLDSSDYIAETENMSILSDAFSDQEELETLDHDIEYLDNEYSTLSQILGDSDELREVFQDRADVPVEDDSPTQSHFVPDHKAEAEADLLAGVDEYIELSEEVVVETPDSSMPEAASHLGDTEFVLPNDPVLPTRAMPEGSDAADAGGGFALHTIVMFIIMFGIAYYSYHTNRQLSAEVASLSNELSQSSDRVDELSTDAKRAPQLGKEVTQLREGLDSELDRGRLLNDEVNKLSSRIQALESKSTVIAQPLVTASAPDSAADRVDKAQDYPRRWQGGGG